MSQIKPLRIIVDNRERKLMEIFDLKSDKIIYESEQLEVADVLVSQDVAIERKEGFDFVSSIVDNRLFEQLLRMKEVYQSPILILEGLNDEVFENTGVNIVSIYGALAFISYKLKIPVIPTRNLEDTAIVIERIAYREQVKDNMPILARKATKQKSLEEKRSFIIEGLEETGPKKAKTLIETFKTPYNVIKAIKNTEIIYTKTNKPKGIKGPLEQLNGFGWKFVQKNREILFGKRKEPQKKLDDL